MVADPHCDRAHAFVGGRADAAGVHLLDDGVEVGGNVLRPHRMLLANHDRQSRVLDAQTRGTMLSR